MFKWRKKIILEKVEATYGTDAAPTGAANAILAGNVEITPFESEQVRREIVQSYLGARQAFHVGQRVSMAFDVEMAGAGSAGGIPKYGPVFRSAAYAETNNVGVDTQYDPVSANEESSTIHFHMDGNKHALVGVRSSLDARIAANEVPRWRRTAMGLYVAPTATADPSEDVSGFVKPLPVTNANTPTFTLDAFAGKLRELTITGGNQVVKRDLVNSESVELTDRDMGGEILIEAPALGTKDFFAIAKAESLVALQVVHGTTAGNIVQLDAPTVQLMNPRYEEQNGIAMLRMGLIFVPSSAGDDEVKWTIK